MTPWQLLGLMFALGRDERVCALDIVEVDPTQDPRRQTVRVAAHALMMFLSGYASRGDAA
jgi:formiminoglutamase